MVLRSKSACCGTSCTTQSKSVCADIVCAPDVCVGPGTLSVTGDVVVSTFDAGTNGGNVIVENDLEVGKDIHNETGTIYWGAFSPPLSDSVSEPLGVVTAFAGNSAPAKWMLCNGQAISRTTYAQLFAIIGTLWGAGDGSTTFNIPDLTDVFPMGAGTANPAASTGGAAQIVQTIDQMPKHDHEVIDPGHTHTMSDLINRSSWKPSLVDGKFGDTPQTRTTSNSKTGITLAPTGAGEPMDIIPPFAAIVYIIKVQF